MWFFLYFFYIFLGAMKKMLLMGSAGVGKTSMHKVIFANFLAKDTSKLVYTMPKEEHKITIMGNIELNVWDCGFQNTFVEEYFNQKKDLIFSNTTLMLYVFGIKEEEDNVKASLYHFRKAVFLLKEKSPDAQVFVLIHKIDLVPQSKRQERFKEKRDMIERVAKQEEVEIHGYFPTTIWDESLYQAWSVVIQSLIPNRPFMRQILGRLCEACNCFDVILFQKSTFLVMMHYSTREEGSTTDYQRIAILLQTLRLSSKKAGGQLKQISFGTKSFSGMVLEFTPTENVMMISEHPLSENKQICQLNVSNLGKYFEKCKSKLN